MVRSVRISAMMYNTEKRVLNLSWLLVVCTLRFSQHVFTNPYCSLDQTLFSTPLACVKIKGLARETRVDQRSKISQSSEQSILFTFLTTTIICFLMLGSTSCSTLPLVKHSHMLISCHSSSNPKQNLCIVTPVQVMAARLS